MLYETSKLNKVQLCIDCSHFCKQDFLECANIPETVNNSMRLGFIVFPVVSKHLRQTNHLSC